MTISTTPPTAFTGTVSPDATFDDVVATVAKDVAKVVSVSPTASAPTIALDASGVPHITIPLTSKAKAFVGGGLALISLAGTDILLTVPTSHYTPFIAGAVTVAGTLAAFLGIHSTTNKPVKL